MRPSGLPIIPETSALLIQEVAEIDGRGRLNVLPRWAKRVDWLPVPPKGDVEALMVFVEPGRLSVRDWASFGPQIVQRYEVLAKKLDDDAVEAVRLIHDRYQRLIIPVDRRAHLGDMALAHLGLPISRGTKSTIYVVAYSNYIDILSPEFRNEKLLSGVACLDDLP